MQFTLPLIARVRGGKVDDHAVGDTRLWGGNEIEFSGRRGGMF